MRKSMLRFVSLSLVLTTMMCSHVYGYEEMRVNSMPVEHKEGFIYGADDFIIPVDVSRKTPEGVFETLSEDETKIAKSDAIVFTPEDITYEKSADDMSLQYKLTEISEELITLDVDNYQQDAQMIESEFVAEGLLVDSFDNMIFSNAETLQSSEKSVKASPDLVVASITTVGNYPFVALGTASMKVFVSNIGGASSAASSCGIYVDGQLIGALSVPTLAVGTGVEFSISIPGIPAGSHTIGAIADYNNKISESNENNNSRSVSFSWMGMPDLTSTLTASQTAPVVGETVNFSFSMKNIGNAKANGTFYADIVVDGVSVGSFTLSNMEANTTVTGSFSLTFGYFGAYSVRLIVDARGNVQESNENNNIATVNVQAQIAKQIALSGTLTYRSYEKYGGGYVVRPLSNYTIQIYDQSSTGDTLITTVTTNSSGSFSKTINNAWSAPEYGYDIYFVVKLDNPYLTLKDKAYNQIIQFQSSVVNGCMEPALSFGTIALDTNEYMQGAFNIYHWIRSSNLYYSANVGSLSKIDVLWDTTSSSTGSFFSPSTGDISISGAGKSHYCATVLTHEYGHSIMHRSGVSPNNAGGAHNMVNPSINSGTAYSEAYATFFSTQVRGVATYDHWVSSSYYLKGYLETLEYEDHSTTKAVIQRRSDFHENAKMELFTGGAMNDLADSAVDGVDTFSGGFLGVNNVVMSAQSNNSIEFYNRYMNQTNSANKVLIWKIFNQNHSAFDYILPTLTITGDATSGYTANATDNVGIERIEWKLNNVVVATGSTYRPPNNLAPGIHYISVYAYDYEGNARGDEVRKDITGNTILRTQGAKIAEKAFYVSTSGGKSSISEYAPNNAVMYLPESLQKT